MNMAIPRKVSLLLGLLFLAVLVFLPHLIDAYFTHIFIMILLYSYLGLAWNIIGGFGGQLSIGHTAFFGVGGYTSTLLFIHLGLTPWVGMFAGGVVSAGLGLTIGFLAFRYGLKGHYFALTTIAFAEVIRLTALNVKFFGAATGLLVPFKGQNAWLFQFTGKIWPYYTVLVLALIGLVVSISIKRSRLGYYLLAIREDEDSAAAIGIDPFKYKMIGIGISAFMTSFGGTFLAQYTMYIQPDFTLALPQSIEILIRPIIGGVGTVAGPIVGAFVLGPISELSRILLGDYSGIHLVVYGSILILFMIFLPDGLMGLWHRFQAKFARLPQEDD